MAELPAITKEEYEKLKEVFEEVGKSLEKAFSPITDQNKILNQMLETILDQNNMLKKAMVEKKSPMILAGEISKQTGEIPAELFGSMNYYQDLGWRTANQSLSEMDQLTDSALGMAAEIGEFCNLLKKVRYQGHEFTTEIKEKMQEELSDGTWYNALGFTALGVKMAEAAAANINKLRKRYPDGFDPERSIWRDSPSSSPKKLQGRDCRAGQCPRNSGDKCLDLMVDIDTCQTKINEEHRTDLEKTMLRDVKERSK
jgi:hypothetical protein